MVLDRHELRENMEHAADAIYASRTRMLEAQLAEAEHRNLLLQGKLEELLRGELATCIADGCNNRLFGRLAQGYSTCSPRCGSIVLMALGYGSQKQRDQFHQVESRAKLQAGHS